MYLQKSFNTSNVTSTFPPKSEGQYSMHIFNEKHDSDNLSFDKFDREITFLLDQMQHQQQDFYSHQEPSRKDSLHDYEALKPSASFQIESSPLDFHFLHLFQKNVDKYSYCSGSQPEGENVALIHTNSNDYLAKPKLLSLPLRPQDNLHKSRALNDESLFSNDIKVEDILESTQIKTEDQVYSNESSMAQGNHYMHEKITIDLNEHVEKLFADLDFIDKPLVGKRIRKTKKQIEERKQIIQQQNNLLRMAGQQVILTDKERRQLKRQQMQILKSEYDKCPTWSKDFIRSLSERIGMNSTQIYKWNWDQRKKEKFETCSVLAVLPFSQVPSNLSNITGIQQLTEQQEE